MSRLTSYFNERLNFIYESVLNPLHLHRILAEIEILVILVHL